MNYKYNSRSYYKNSRREKTKSMWIYVTPLLIVVLANVALQIIALNISPDSAIKAAETLGYTNVTVTDRQTFMLGLKGCGNGDGVKFNITATDPKGQTQAFYFCQGFLFKGATPRFD